MPYATPLRDFPSLPHPSGKIVNDDGTPSREWMNFFVALKAWADTVRAALDEVEPP